MFSNEENIKDTTKNPLKDTFSLDVPYKGHGLISDSYPKLNKLITALYIVTDILEKSEPIRLKLRTFGADILSDMNLDSRSEIKDKVEAVIALLDISMTINLISEMNANILKKEFKELRRSIGDTQQKIGKVSHTWLEEFLSTPSRMLYQNQQTENLLKTHMDTTTSNVGIALNPNSKNASLILKKERRDDIFQAIKDNGGSATITEVKLKAPERLAICGEKTLQRELISMVKEDLLHKNGEKRWSRYFIKNNDTNTGNEHGSQSSYIMGTDPII